MCLLCFQQGFNWKESVLYIYVYLSRTSANKLCGVFSINVFVVYIKCTKCSILHSKAHVVVYLQCAMSIMYSYVAMWEYPFNAHSSA